jgi:hypothetical protein
MEDFAVILYKMSANFLPLSPSTHGHYFLSSLSETSLKMIFHSKAVAFLGCLSYLASLPIAAVLQPKTLSTRSAPYMARILDTGTTFLEEDKGVWQLIE